MVCLPVMLATVVLALSGAATPQDPRAVVFATADGGSISADVYGVGEHGVVLAHGAVFDKSSWEPFARRLAAAGFRVLAIDFRGYGSSRAGTAGRALDEDVLAAIRFLRQAGVGRVSVIGGSMGGGAAARAATRVGEGEIDRLVLLAPAPIDRPEAIRAGSTLFIASAGEPARERIAEQFQRAPEPKRFELLAGDAHAQHIFRTARSEELQRLILDFLGAASGEAGPGG